MASLCDNPTAEMTAIDRADTNDLTVMFAMRYKLASDPDSAYLPVTTTKIIMGVTYPFFDVKSVEPGIYVVHTYARTDGTSTGTKVTVEVVCDDEALT